MDSMIVDAHQHFWKYNPVRDSWITNEMKVIQRDFMPADLKPLLDENSIDGCIAIQADQSEKETEFLLALTHENAWIKGVVGWVNLLRDDFIERLDYFAYHSRFKGIRHILQAEADGFMTNPKFIEGVSALSKRNLTYDILTTEKQLSEVLIFIKKLPEMKLVIDHISKPEIKNRSFDQWASFMKQISFYKHVHIKLSGMITEADWHSWKTTDLKPYIDFCLECFSPDRLMFGSDWPVCLVAGSYNDVVTSFKESIGDLSSTEQAQLMGETAVKFYNLESHGSSS